MRKLVVTNPQRIWIGRRLDHIQNIANFISELTALHLLIKIITRPQKISSVSQFENLDTICKRKSWRERQTRKKDIVLQ